MGILIQQVIVVCEGIHLNDLDQPVVRGLLWWVFSSATKKTEFGKVTSAEINSEQRQFLARIEKSGATRGFSASKRCKESFGQFKSAEKWTTGDMHGGNVMQLRRRLIVEGDAQRTPVDFKKHFDEFNKIVTELTTLEEKIEEEDKAKCDGGIVRMTNKVESRIAGVGTVQICMFDGVIRMLINAKHVLDLRMNLIL
ncbi:hypothetical protein ACLOJK_025613 [Asimina triloba]